MGLLMGLLMKLECCVVVIDGVGVLLAVLVGVTVLVGV
jgi:hypothetical protein